VVLAIDQGTSGTTCLVVDGELRPRGRGFRLVRQYYPRPGWVEHDPEDIWQSVVAATDKRSSTQMFALATCRRSGSRTSARRRCCGTADRASPCSVRSSGRDRPSSYLRTSSPPVPRCGAVSPPSTAGTAS
jgi:hypothetical protein